MSVDPAALLKKKEMSFESCVLSARCNEEFRLKFLLKADIIRLEVVHIPPGNVTGSIRENLLSGPNLPDSSLELLCRQCSCLQAFIQCLCAAVQPFVTTFFPPRHKEKCAAHV